MFVRSWIYTYCNSFKYRCPISEKVELGTSTLRCVGVIQFVFHVLQLLPMQVMYDNTCITLAIIDEASTKIKSPFIYLWLSKVYAR